MMIVTALTKLIGAGALVLAVVAGPAYTEDTPATAPTSGERAGWALLESARADGLTCSTEPVLTDHIVVRTPETARVVSFDEALELSARGVVTVVAYCQEDGE